MEKEGCCAAAEAKPVDPDPGKPVDPGPVEPVDPAQGHGSSRAAQADQPPVGPAVPPPVVRCAAAAVPPDDAAQIGYLQNRAEMLSTDPYAWLLLGNVLDQKGRQEEALVAYKRGIDANPKEYRNYVSACRMLRCLGRIEATFQLAEKAVREQVLHDPWQLSSHFVYGLEAKAWWDVSSWRVGRILEGSFEKIRDEAMPLLQNGKLVSSSIPDTEDLVRKGKWTELNLIHQGVTQAPNQRICPYITGLLESQIPEAASMVRGACKLSVLQPGTKVRPHHGPTNTRMRVHLGIHIPEGAFIRAGNPAEESNIRQWKTGKCICFDDSYEHEVWHDGSEERLVLIVDVWHPAMTHQDRLASCRDNLQRQIYLARFEMGKASAGWS